MTQRTLAHLSDLHVGRNDDADDEVLSRMCRSLLKRNVEHVVVTGDVTHRGRRAEWQRFQRAFAPLAERGRLTVVPGNHDRLGDDVGADMLSSDGQRVMVASHPGLHLVCFDSTGPHNRKFISSHGEMSAGDVTAIVAAFDQAPPRALAVLLLHHHLVPLPHDNHAERMLSWLGWGSGGELPLGRELLSILRGRCDLVLHGHRHDPVSIPVFSEDARPLHLFNAGSSTELGHVRLFAHRWGRLVAPPLWLPLGQSHPMPFHEYVGAGQLAESDSAS
jgi:3',5'-cyclic-AMP phosphodiesterase